MPNILSIDVEDYFMVSAFEGVVRREDWHAWSSRIERNVHRVLEILDSSAARPVQATFFCLGWVAEKFPGLILEVHTRGHEIASHGYDHRMVTTLSPARFREDIRKSKSILEDITGDRVLGYRAPSYTITSETLWALPILAEEGFVYDSSIFPVRHDRYGIPMAPRSPYAIPISSHNGGAKKVIYEFPITTTRLLGQNLPTGGGGYFRIFPESFTRWALRRVMNRDGCPVVFYLHPWEIDPEQPRPTGLSPRSRFRHYTNLGKTEGRFRRLLADLPFTSFRSFLRLKGHSGRTEVSD